ncbi:hypothetical protein [Aestuariivirga sp.]|jgi:hypothetical protein|uniref:hypothetical protein n=1 Tax=Aestuariivirga sp. TaxID=2650926 RepID=UPI003783F3CE
MTIKMFAVAAAAALLLAGLPQVVQAKSIGPTGAAIVGGVAGLAIGAAIADANRPKKKIYYEGYAPPYRPGNYDPYFNQAFSPATGIVCYPAQRLCYNNGGSVSGNWTRKVYGY